MKFTRISVLVLSTTLILGGCKEEPQVEPTLTQHPPIDVTRELGGPMRPALGLWSIQTELSAQRFGGLVPVRDYQYTSIPPTAEWIADARTLDQITQDVFPLYAATEDTCVGLTRLFMGLERLATPQSGDWVCHSDPFVVFAASVYHAKPYDLCGQSGWPLVRYHTLRAILPDYLHNCRARYEIQVVRADRTSTSTYGCGELAGPVEDMCRRPQRWRLDREIGEAVYPGVSDPVAAAKKVLEYGRTATISERGRLAYEVYDDVVTAHLYVMREDPLSPKPLGLKLVDYLDLFMPYGIGSWSDWGELLFDEALCQEQGLTVARRQKSYDLWLSRLRREPGQRRDLLERVTELKLPRSVQDYCSPPEPALHGPESFRGAKPE